MCEAEKAWEKKKVDEGIQLGIEQGIELGKTQGIEQGRQQGQKELVLKLIHNGKTIEEVATLFGETPSVIQMIIQ